MGAPEFTCEWAERAQLAVALPAALKFLPAAALDSPVFLSNTLFAVVSIRSGRGHNFGFEGKCELESM